MGLTQKTHFEEGSTECIIHRCVVNWKSIGSNYHKYLERHEKNYDSRAKDCQVHAVRGSRASCQRYQNDIYIGINQGRITNLEIRLQADCAINSCANYSWLNCGSAMSM